MILRSMAAMGFLDRREFAFLRKLGKIYPFAWLRVVTRLVTSVTGEQLARSEVTIKYRNPHLLYKHLKKRKSPPVCFKNIFKF